MKAVICTKYGSPEFLEIQEVEIPKKNEICIKIHAAEVTASDIFMRSLNLSFHMQILMRLMLVFSKPRRGTMGLYFAGVIESVGNTKTSKLKIACKKVLSAKGRYTSIDDGLLRLDFELVKRLTDYCEAGYIRPVLDRIYTMDEIVQAHQYVKKGGVAISI